MVRLKAAIDLTRTVTFPKFQFLMVRLKAYSAALGSKTGIAFQFLMVRLKDLEILLILILTHVSIPYGTIKSICSTRIY